MGSKNFSVDLGTRVSKPNRAYLNRRHFLLGLAAISTAALIPTAISCSASPIHDIHNQLTDEDFTTLTAVQNHLFPRSKNSPGASDIHAAQYYTWVLMDTEKDADSLTQLRDGIRWTTETADETYGKKFFDLDKDQKEKVIQLMANEGWGENWLSVTLTLIFEALLSDPIYGSNTDESGWKWLEHTAGNPRADKSQMYNPVAL
tara:strand:+ start:96998 stop:97606 length:609 start_codon:yes stop_codon:yes gene_type:complete